MAGVDDILAAAGVAADRHQQTETELDELSAAQDSFNDVARSTTEAALADLRDLERLQQETSASREQSFAAMEADIARLNELNSMPGIADRVIGPFAAMFDPDWDRAKLASKIQLEQTKAQLATSRLEQEQQRVALRQEARGTQLRQAGVEVTAEGQDVANLQAKLESARAAVADRRGFKSEFLKSASVDELREGVQTGFITERDMNAAIRSERAAELALSGAAYNQTLREMNAMDDDTLRKTADEAGPMQALAQEEVARRTRRRSQADATRRVAQEYRMQSAELATLDAMVESGEITGWQAQNEKDRREALAVARSSAELALAANNKAALEGARGMWLKSQSNQMLEKMFEAATEAGGRLVDQDSGLEFDVTEIDVVLQQRQAAIAGRVTGQIAAESAKSSLGAVATQAARTMGLDVPNANDPEATGAVWRALAADASTPPELKQAAAEVATLEKLMQTTQVPDGTAAELYARANASVSAAVAAHTEAMAALQPKEQQPAYLEWQRTGEVSSNLSAMAAVGPSAISGQDTGNDFYDASLHAMRDAAVMHQQNDPRLQTESLPDIINAMGPRFAEDPAVRQPVLAAAMNQGTMEVYRRTFMELGDEQALNMMANPGSDFYNGGGQFDDVKMLEFLEARGDAHPASRQKFQDTSRRMAVQYADRELQPRGRHGAVQASISKLIFGNDPSSTFIGQFDRQSYMNMRAFATNQGQGPDAEYRRRYNYGPTESVITGGIRQ